MKEKLLELMKSEGLKSSQLAEMLEINPAGVSHILAGRNKPGFDLLQKILRRFPRINPDWLMLDSDKMYRDENSIARTTSADGMTTPASSHPLGGLFDEHAETSGTPSARLGATAAKIPESANETATVSATEAASSFTTPKTDKPIERVVVFYADQTFDSYSPTKR